MLGPLRDHGLLCARSDAEAGDCPCLRLVQVALMEAGQEERYLGQQAAAAGGGPRSSAAAAVV